jgi:hypothetical protein
MLYMIVHFWLLLRFSRSMHGFKKHKKCLGICAHRVQVYLAHVVHFFIFLDGSVCRDIERLKRVENHSVEIPKGFRPTRDPVEV